MTTMATVKQGDKLGSILVSAGLITAEQLEKALRLQQGTTKRIGQLLVELGLVTDADIAVALGKQLGIPYVTQASGLLIPRKDQGLETLIPADFARSHLVLPLSRHLGSLTIACANPHDLILMDNLVRLTSCEINPVVSPKTDLEQAIDLFYEEEVFQEAIGKSYELTDELPVSHEEAVTSLDQLKQAAEEAPVIRLVDLIIRQAIRDRASDIHVEPFKDKLVVRYRIDGVDRKSVV